LHFLIEMTCRASFRGVQTTITDSIGKKSDGQETRLSIVPACVLYRNRWTGEDDQRIRKIQTSRAERSLTLYRIEGDLHKIKCTPINYWRQRRLFEDATQPPFVRIAVRAFSSEVDTGSREENA